MFRAAAFHHTVVRHRAHFFATHFFVHALRAAKASLHSMVTFFHHHFMLAAMPAMKTVMCHLADAACYKAGKKDESDYQSLNSNLNKSINEKRPLRSVGPKMLSLVMF